jgi:hypothetical protein
MKRLCSINNSGCKHNTRHWSLKNYYGITGYLCSHHYYMVSHNSYGIPNNKSNYTKIKNLLEKNKKEELLEPRNNSYGCL